MPLPSQPHQTISLGVHVQETVHGAEGLMGVTNDLVWNERVTLPLSLNKAAPQALGAPRNPRRPNIHRLGRGTIGLETAINRDDPVEPPGRGRPRGQTSTRVMTVEGVPGRSAAAMNDNADDTSVQTPSDDPHGSEFTCTIKLSRDVPCQLTPPPSATTPAQSNTVDADSGPQTPSKSSRAIHHGSDFKREASQAHVDRKNRPLPPLPISAPVPGLVPAPLSASASAPAVKSRDLKRHKSFGSLAIGKLSQACKSTLALPAFGQHGSHKEQEVAKAKSPRLAKKKSFFGRHFTSWGKSSPDLSIETGVRASTPPPPSDDSTIEDEDSEDEDPEDEPLYARILLPSRRSRQSLWVKVNGVSFSSKLWLLRPVNIRSVQRRDPDFDSDTDSAETTSAPRTPPRRPRRLYFHSSTPKR